MGVDFLPAAAILIIGVVIGAIISRFITVTKDRASSLAKQLDEVHAEYASYQEQVDDHFRKTTGLLSELSDTYGAMHQHLALGVQTLSQRNLPHVSNQSKAGLEHQTEQPEQAPLLTKNSDSSPPKDYAAGANQHNHGMLSEQFTATAADGTTAKQDPLET